MTTILQRIALLTATCCLGGLVHAQTGNVGINNDGSTPDPNALLDISSNYLAPANQKGLLIPRMTRAQRLAIAGGAPANSLMVYQTNNFTNQPRGFYYYSTAAAAWIRLGTGVQWTLAGNGGTDPTTDFLGPVNNQGLRFRTNNVERMVLDQNGNLAVGLPAAVERLDIGGAIKLTGTSATDDVGTIRWNAVGQYHEGNIDGTPTGWRKLQNDYQEVEDAPYLQAGTVTCTTGFVDLGEDDGLSNNVLVSPYWNTNGVRFAKHQFLFRVGELDLGLNQIGGNPGATEGLCPGPITRIALWAESIVGSNPRAWIYSVTLMHTTANDLTANYAASSDVGSDRCFFVSPAQVHPHTTAPPFAGWVEYDFSGDPFVWNGVDNIAIQIVRGTLASQPFGASSTGYNVRKTDLSWNGSRAHYGVCTATDPGDGCGSIQGSGITPANCSTGGPSTVRPVVRWWGQRADAPPAVNALGNYIQFDGGFLVEETAGWAALTGPYSFKGPGTISAESGVWDDDTRLNDHVFDRYFDGRVRPEEAAVFGEHRHHDIKAMAAHTATDRHLPTMKGRTDWMREKGFSLGDLANQLWVTTETQALYLTELDQRARALELMRGDGPLDPGELEIIKNVVCGMEHLTERQKETLLQANRARSVKQAIR